MLQQWLLAGGGLEIARLELVWGSLALEGAGSLALDPRLMPSGRIEARMSGLPETMDRLVAAKMLRSDRADLVKAVLSALAEGADSTGRPVVALPITLEEGRLFLGPVQLFRFSPAL